MQPARVTIAERLAGMSESREQKLATAWSISRARSGPDAARARTMKSSRASSTCSTTRLRCGTLDDRERDPANRLRLTVGLRREQGRWMIAYEHHSFPDKP